MSLFFKSDNLSSNSGPVTSYKMELTPLFYVILFCLIYVVKRLLILYYLIFFKKEMEYLRKS